MNIFTAFALVLMAGLINGSFALPAKHITKWQFENVWLLFAFWAFVILPWVVIWVLVPQVGAIYAEIPTRLLWFIIVGGLFFGAGQMCFALSMQIIGLGLGFVINLGLSIGLGFMLPLIIQHPDEIATHFGYVTLIGTGFAIVGLVIANYAGLLRDRDKLKVLSDGSSKELQNTAKCHYSMGVLLAILAGLSSAGQNFIFSFTYGVQKLALDMGANRFGAAVIIWPLFLICAFIPYAFYTLYLHRKNSSFANYNKFRVTTHTQSSPGLTGGSKSKIKQQNTGFPVSTGNDGEQLQFRNSKYFMLTAVMGIFWYGSLILYSKASQLIGTLGPLIGWPLFMVMIILTSSFWSFQHKEWEWSSLKTKKVMYAGLACLFFSIVILAYSSVLPHS